MAWEGDGSSGGRARSSTGIDAGRLGCRTVGKGRRVCEFRVFDRSSCGLAVLFLAVQSCTLLAGTDVRRSQALRGTPMRARHVDGIPDSVSFRTKVALHVARLRGGGGDDAAQMPTAPLTKSWADLVKQSPRSRTPSVNVEAVHSPIPQGLSPDDAVQGERIPIEMLTDLNLDVDDHEVAQAEASNECGGNIMPFMTDAEICELAARQQGPGTQAGQDRELEPFVCDDEQFEGRLEDDPEAQLDQTSKRVRDFDQFKMNEEKFGIKTDGFNEDDYTAPIDTMDPAYPEQVKRAEQLAAEIEGSWGTGGTTTMENMHLRDERNLPLPHDLDEATLYSTVNHRRQDVADAAQVIREQERGGQAASAPASLDAGTMSAARWPGGGLDEEEEMEVMKSEELEEVLEEAYDRYCKIVDNNEPWPPEVQAVLDSVQVRTRVTDLATAAEQHQRVMSHSSAHE